MNYFSEDAKHIEVVCDNCKRVIKVEKINCIETDNGYKLVQPEKCVCDYTFEEIVGTHRTKIYREASEAYDALVCPHCRTRGRVQTKTVKRKKGISGGKVMGGILTGGISLLATGLSRKEQETEAHCSNCGSTWYF